MANEVPVVRIATEVDDQLAAAVEALLPQLSGSAVFSRALLDAVVNGDNTELFVASISGRIVGVATLVTFPIPTGLRGHIDDVVVDEHERGHGIGRVLLEAMIESAAVIGVRTLDLTSRPSRSAAIRLYESVGFVRRDSQLFRYVERP